MGIIENFTLFVDELAGSTTNGIMAVIYIVVAYFLGTLSPAIIIGRMHGVDIRKEGSGNAGSTNMLRTLGKKAAAATFIIDVAKGFLAVFAANLLVGRAFAILCLIAVMCGHIWPVYLGFKGGKGAATALGAIFAFDPRVGGIVLLVVAVFMAASRRVSVATLVAAVAFPLVIWFFRPVYLAPALVVTVIIWVKHRQNIARLVRGEEPTVSFRKKQG